MDDTVYYTGVIYSVIGTNKKGDISTPISTQDKSIAYDEMKRLNEGFSGFEFKIYESDLLTK